MDIVDFVQFDGKPFALGGDVASSVARPLTLASLRDRFLADEPPPYQTWEDFERRIAAGGLPDGQVDEH